MRMLAPAFAALSACTGAHAPAPPAAEVPAPPTQQLEPAPHVSPPTTYGALLELLARRGDELPGAGCAFAHEADGVVYRGPFAPAVQPLPPPPHDVSKQLREAAAVEVLTRYGRYNVPAPALTLATFSDAPPCPTPLVVALGADGGTVSRALAVAAPGAASASQSAGPACAVLTADAEVPLQRVAQALSELSARGLEVSLASALPTGASLPRTPPSAPRSCPNGLPELEAPAGELSREQLREALRPLQGPLLGCLQGARSVAAHAGGVVRVALRIDAAGNVAASCVTESELPDDAVVSCVLERTAGLRFGAPSPAGSVDVVLPLRLSPEFAPAPRASCEAP